MTTISGALAGLRAIWRELRLPGVKRTRNEQAIAKGREERKVAARGSDSWAQ